MVNGISQHSAVNEAPLYWKPYQLLLITMFNYTNRKHWCYQKPAVLSKHAK